jgi:succinyl-CoA synthetase alpha subunit
MKISRRQAMLYASAGMLGAAGYGLSRIIGSGAEIAEGRSRARLIETVTAPPSTADVVVIGGGNIGAATAYYLAKNGQSVVLCEKGAIGGEASGRSVGHVFSLGMPVSKLPITIAAKQLWTNINAELQVETWRTFVGCRD